MLARSSLISCSSLILTLKTIGCTLKHKLDLFVNTAGAPMFSFHLLIILELTDILLRFVSFREITSYTCSSLVVYFINYSSLFKFQLEAVLSKFNPEESHRIMVFVLVYTSCKLKLLYFTFLLKCTQYIVLLLNAFFHANYCLYMYEVFDVMRYIKNIRINRS